jgi:hypothetical protein
MTAHFCRLINIPEIDNETLSYEVYVRVGVKPATVFVSNAKNTDGIGSGWAWLKFDNGDDLMKAVAILNNCTINGNVIQVTVV